MTSSHCWHRCFRRTTKLCHTSNRKPSHRSRLIFDRVCSPRRTFGMSSAAYKRFCDERRRQRGGSRCAKAAGASLSMWGRVPVLGSRWGVVFRPGASCLRPTRFHCLQPEPGREWTVCQQLLILRVVVNGGNHQTET